MEWNRSNTIGLASESCCYCNGDGMRPVYEDKQAPCNCVFRAAFRACYARFRECAISGEQPGNVEWEIIGGPGGRRMYSRRHEEFMADFTLIARRELNDLDYKIFRIYHLLGATGGWLGVLQDGPRQLLARGLSDRTEAGAGILRNQPYPLFPLDEYFGWTFAKSRCARCTRNRNARTGSRFRIACRLDGGWRGRSACAGLPPGFWGC